MEMGAPVMRLSLCCARTLCNSITSSLLQCQSGCKHLYSSLLYAYIHCKETEKDVISQLPAVKSRNLGLSCKRTEAVHQFCM